MRNTEGLWDGMYFEVAAAENGTPNNVRNALKHCAKKGKTEVAVIFYPKEFNNDDFFEGLSIYNGLKKLKDGQYKEFKEIYLINKDKEIIKKNHATKIICCVMKRGTCPDGIKRSPRTANIHTKSEVCIFFCLFLCGKIKI